MDAHRRDSLVATISVSGKRGKHVYNASPAATQIMRNKANNLANNG